MVKKTDPISFQESFPCKSPSYSQLAAISDPSLRSLRDQIKKVMIPMLIKIFQLKLELSQSISPSSRLQLKSKESPEQITSQLKRLDEDLKLLSMWCDSSRNQIAKVLCIPEEEHKNVKTATTHLTPDPAVVKSFSDAVSSQPPLFKAKENLQHPKEELPPNRKKKRWWKQLFSSKISLDHDTI